PRPANAYSGRTPTGASFSGSTVSYVENTSRRLRLLGEIPGVEDSASPGGARPRRSGYVSGDSPVRGLGVGHYGCWNEAAVFRGRGTAGRACRRTGAGVGFGARSGRPRWLPPLWPALGVAAPGMRWAFAP